MASFLQSWGYVAIIIFGVLQAACIPISSELTFLLGGALASAGMSATHHLNLALVIIAGTVAELVGSYVSYGVGRKGGRPLVHRWGRYVLVTQHDVDRAERFLVGRGAWAIPVARMLPVIRAFTSIVAGLVEVPPVRFGLLNVIGTVIYISAMSSIGYALGNQWDKFHSALSVGTYVLVVAVVLAVAGYVFHRLRAVKKETAYAAKHGGKA